MKKNSLLGFILVYTLFLTNICLADIKLPKCFSDSMIVQRQVEFPVWGEALPEEELTLFVQRDGEEKIQLKTKADKNGRWSVSFPALKLGKAYTLSIQGKDSTVLVRDILAGDVWLCSGQSNMEWPIKRLPDHEQIVKKIKENKNLRSFIIHKAGSREPLENITNARHWEVVSSKNAANSSAVALFFGMKLQAQAKVPIGLVEASWGGSSCEAWISQPGMESEPKLAALVKFQKGLTKGQPNRRMSQLYNGMIAPINRMKIKGVIWYQGESNVGRGFQYRTLFPKMIQDWRKTFNNPKLPFLFVQLAPFRYKARANSALAEVWDAQLHTFKTVPNTGMVVTTDLGDANDIHPRQKKPVGERLADFAFAEVYQQFGPVLKPAKPEVGKEKPKTTEEKTAKPVKVTTKTQPEQKKASPVYCGPIYKSFQVKESTIEIEFFVSDGILKSSDGKPLREFLIAGADRKFVPAEAKVVGNKLVVSSKDVAEPVAVRYCWRDTPNANFVGSTGLPASPFRTDEFPLLSKDKEY